MLACIMAQRLAEASKRRRRAAGRRKRATGRGLSAGAEIDLFEHGLGDGQPREGVDE
jgi:hypothetical protein